MPRSTVSAEGMPRNQGKPYDRQIPSPGVNGLVANLLKAFWSRVVVDFDIYSEDSENVRALTKREIMAR